MYLCTYLATCTYMKWCLFKRFIWSIVLWMHIFMLLCFYTFIRHQSSTNKQTIFWWFTAKDECQMFLPQRLLPPSSISKINIQTILKRFIGYIYPLLLYVLRNLEVLKPWSMTPIELKRNTKEQIWIQKQTDLVFYLCHCNVEFFTCDVTRWWHSLDDV